MACQAKTKSQSAAVCLSNGRIVPKLIASVPVWLQPGNRPDKKNNTERVKTGFRHSRQKGLGFVHPLEVRKHTADPVNQCVEPQGSQQGGRPGVFLLLFTLYSFLDL